MNRIAVFGLMVLASATPACASEEALKTADQGTAMSLAIAGSCEDEEFNAFASDYAKRLYEAAGSTETEATARIEEITKGMKPADPIDEQACTFFATGLRQGEAATIAKIRALAGS